MVGDNASHANMDLVWACDKGAAEGELLRRRKGAVRGEEGRA